MTCYRTTISHLQNLLNQHGPDYWWTLSKEELIPNEVVKELKLSPDDIDKSQVTSFVVIFIPVKILHVFSDKLVLYYFLVVYNHILMFVSFTSNP